MLDHPFDQIPLKQVEVSKQRGRKKQEELAISFPIIPKYLGLWNQQIPILLNFFILLGSLFTPSPLMWEMVLG